MGLAEIIMIAAGISLDMVGVMICYGALMPHIRTETLVRLCLIIAPWQVIVLLAGSCLRRILPTSGHSTTVVSWCAVLAALIFLGLGIFLFVKAARQEVLYEYRRDTLENKVIFLTAMATSVDALFAGIGLGFMNTELMAELAAVLTATVAAIICGIYLGYRWGSEQRGKAYTAGGILLCAAGIDMLIRYL